MKIFSKTVSLYRSVIYINKYIHRLLFLRKNNKSTNHASKSQFPFERILSHYTVLVEFTKRTNSIFRIRFSIFFFLARVLQEYHYNALFIYVFIFFIMYSEHLYNLNKIHQVISVSINLSLFLLSLSVAFP